MSDLSHIPHATKQRIVQDALNELLYEKVCNLMPRDLAYVLRSESLDHGITLTDAQSEALAELALYGLTDETDDWFEVDVTVTLPRPPKAAAETESVSPLDEHLAAVRGTREAS